MNHGQQEDIVIFGDDGNASIADGAPELSRKSTATRKNFTFPGNP